MFCKTTLWTFLCFISIIIPLRSPSSSIFSSSSDELDSSFFGAAFFVAFLTGFAGAASSSLELSSSQDD